MFHLFWAQMDPTAFNFNVKSFPGTFFSVTGSINPEVGIRPWNPF